MNKLFMPLSCLYGVFWVTGMGYFSQEIWHHCEHMLHLTAVDTVEPR